MEGSDPSRVRARWAAQSFRRPTNGRSLRGRLKDLIALRPAPARIWVTDHQRAYTFDPQQGLAPAELPRESCDVLLGSESLHFAFKFLWGGQTLAINGRFQEAGPESRRTLFDYFNMAGNRNAGRVLTWKSLPDDVGRQLGQVKQQVSSKVNAWLHG
jgi:hypothetical protein